MNLRWIGTGDDGLTETHLARRIRRVEALPSFLPHPMSHPSPIDARIVYRHERYCNNKVHVKHSPTMLSLICLGPSHGRCICVVV